MNKILITNPGSAGLVSRIEAFAICMAVLIALIVLLVVAIQSSTRDLSAMSTFVELPKFSNGRLLMKHFINFPGSTCYSIDIEIDKQKRIRLNRRETTMANLRAQILQELGQRKVWITLKIDQRVPYGWVMEMAKFLRDSGWDRFFLVVEGQPSELHHCE